MIFIPNSKTVVDRVDDVHSITSPSSLQDFVHIEPDIITSIFSHLNLSDRLNLAQTCKEIECFHNSRPDFWKSVWLDASKAEVTHNMARNYSNIELQIDFDPSTPSPLAVLTPLAPTMKSLQMSQKKKPVMKENHHFEETKVHPSRLIETLPLFADLASLDLSEIGRRDYDYDGNVQIIILDFTNVVPPATPTVVMTNLQCLKINLDLVAGLRGHMNLSEITGLHTIEISNRYDLGGIANDELYAARRSVFALIRQQRGLKSLMIDFGESVDLFNRPLALPCQLENFSICDLEEEDFSTLRYQQDNIADFISSQTQLKKMKLEIWRDECRISSKMLHCVAQTLSLQHTVQSIKVSHEWLNVCAGDDGCKLTMRELRQIFQSQAVAPNNSTKRLNLRLNGLHSKSYHEWFIPGLCSLYPCLNHVSIYSNCALIPNLTSMGSLNHLHSLELTMHRIGVSLRDVEIPSLKKLTVCFTSQMKHGASWELKKFIGRHKKLTHVKFVLAEAYYVDYLNYLRTFSRQRLAKDTLNLIRFAVENLHELEMLDVIADTGRFVDQSEFSPCMLSIIDHPNPQLIVNIVMLQKTMYYGVEMPENIGVKIYKTSGEVNWSHITKNDSTDELA